MRVEGASNFSIFPITKEQVSFLSMISDLPSLYLLLRWFSRNLVCLNRPLLLHLLLLIIESLV